MSSLPDETIRHLQHMMTRPEVPGDRYLLAEILGQGGMGTVYRATDRLLGREVALKVLRPEAAESSLVARLQREARILAGLEHPGIVPVHDAGMLADGRVYYVMKLVRGVRLDEWVTGVPRSEALRSFLRVVEAVSFAHARGILHRDLKPANIMVGAFGEVLVLDWGIARVMGARADSTGEPGAGGGAPGEPGNGGDTAPGMILGTPGFMAPEQARGEVDAVDQRSDVYALGVSLRSITNAGGRARPLESICERATAPLAADRYPDAAALGREITRFLDGEAVEAHRETLPERLERLYARYQTPILLVTAYLAMRLLFLVLRGF